MLEISLPWSAYLDENVWEHEAKDFTPWLVANPDVLGEALGLEIEFTQSEPQVGPYAVDIIGKDHKTPMA